MASRVKPRASRQSLDLSPKMEDSHQNDAEALPPSVSWPESVTGGGALAPEGEALLERMRRGRTALLGLGVEHRALARFLAARGIRFQVCDAVRPPDWVTLEQELGTCLAGWRLGPAYLQDLEDFDLVFRTPGIAPDCRELERARKNGIWIDSQTRLFAALCPAPLIGVTGTKGKGTTASLLAAMLQTGDRPRVWLGGNIGTPPIRWLGEIGTADRVVLELSSFQLADWETSPHGAVLLHVTRDHLDYHRSVTAYRQAKQRICRYQEEADWLVVDDDCPAARTLARSSPATLLRFSRTHAVRYGAWVHDRQIHMRMPGGETQPVCSVADIRLRGPHNWSNVAAAVAAAGMCGVAPADIRQAVRSFGGLPHRLQQVALYHDVAFYDDSMATTPEAAAASLAAFDHPVVLLAGGAGKGLDYGVLADAIVRHPVRAVVLIGQDAGRIAAALAAAGFAAHRVVDGGTSMDAAVRSAHGRARRGDVVLLAPACASFDMFDDYAHRGAAFAAAVQALSGGSAGSRNTGS